MTRAYQLARWRRRRVAAAPWPGRAAVLLAALGLICNGAAGAADADAASVLRARQVELAARLQDSPLHAALLVESAESSERAQADVYAQVDRPFALVSEALAGTAHWCDVLILHLNTEYCGLEGAERSGMLDVSIGRRYDQPIQDAYRVEFAVRVVAATPDYLDVHLDAKSGPGGTNAYDIRLEALASGEGKTFLHLENSFGFDFFAAAVLKGYLMTAGREKIGFTIVDADAAQPAYIGGVRGLVERNAMRYYLGVDAYLNALTAPPAEQLERRMHLWFAATERYARQLHEIDEKTYVDLKRMEAGRQHRPDSP
jgi:hypothetical protein